MSSKKLMIGVAIAAFLAFWGVVALVALVTAQSAADETTKLRFTQSEERGDYQGDQRPVDGGLDDDIAEAESLLERASIDRSEAADTALAEVSGEIVGLGLDDEAGRAVYQVEVLDQDGRLHEIFVDAENGEILGQTTEDQDDADEARSLIERASMDRAAAEDAALEEFPGQVLETDLDDEDGYAVYSVEILGDDGDLYEVAVNAENGEILGQETESSDGSEYEDGFDD